MSIFTRRRKRAPSHQQFAAMLRDFQDLTGFTTGAASGSITSAAALQRHGGWLGIAVRPVVDRIARLQWQALDESGEDDEGAPILDLLRSPNSMCDGAMLLRITAQSLVLSGEAYLLKVRGSRSGTPRQLVPISPDRVERRFRDDGSVEYSIAPPNGVAGEAEVHPAEDVVRIWRPLPSDPWEAYGAAAMLVHEVEAEDAWRRSVRLWMERDARPQTVLEFPEDLDHFMSSTSMPGWDTYINSWNALQSRRQGGMFGTPVPLPPGAKMRELSGLGETNNLGPTEQALRSKILSALGVPPFLLGAAHEANRASAEASLWAFDFSAVRPWVDMITCALNHQLVEPDFPGQRLQFADWIWRDRLAESEIDMRLLQQKVIAPNEAREKRNLQPATWGGMPVGQDQDRPYTGENRPPSRDERVPDLRGLSGTLDPIEED